MESASIQPSITEKMRRESIPEASIAAFLAAVDQVRAGHLGVFREADLEPVRGLPRMTELPAKRADDASLLSQLGVIKLNGGLGTGMGLERAKSLMTVKDDNTFLDLIARQILALRGQTGTQSPAFLLLNSFVTREDSLHHLKAYPALIGDGPLDLLQSKVPKLDEKTLLPIEWPADPDMEWCPPGHGDIYPTLHAGDWVERFLQTGVRYLFVSNADNLGATVDLGIARYFAESGVGFLMEVAERTDMDRKGGHLALRRADGRLVLRESAQTHRDDVPFFQDIGRHGYFNTNNLWIALEPLRDLLQQRQGFLPLPLIRNLKTVDPRDASSPRVLQLESAMGAAIECFERSAALVVPRERFLPVKSTADLLLLRSDLYRLTQDARLERAQPGSEALPVVDLDPVHYRVMSSFEAAFSHGVPSLARCQRLNVVGPWVFEAGVRLRGEVSFVNTGAEVGRVRAGVYENVTVGA